MTVIEIPLQKPTLKCAADVTVAAMPNSCSTTVNSGLQPAEAKDNCTAINLLKMRVSMSGATVQQDSLVAVNQGANGFSFNVGTTKIRYILADASNNVDTAFMNVLVLDKQCPVLTCTPDLTFTSTNGCVRKVLGLKPTANDNCSPNNLQFTYTLSGATPNPTTAKTI